jgi:hypothetical protein
LAGASEGGVSTQAIAHLRLKDIQLSVSACHFSLDGCIIKDLKILIIILARAAAVQARIETGHKSIMRALLIVWVAGIGFAQQTTAHQQWVHRRHSDPSGEVPAGARVQSIQAMERSERAQHFTAGYSPTGAMNWKLLGPQPTDGESTKVTAGRVNAVAIDPRHNNVVYRATLSSRGLAPIHRAYAH